jgi:hypothetical protein
MATAHLRSLVLVSSLIASVALAAPRAATTAGSASTLTAPPARHVAIASKKIAVKDATTPLDLFFISNPNAPFAVTLDTEDHRGGYVEGERFRVAITATVDCYITLLSWGTQGEIEQVAPAKATTGSDEPLFLKKGETLVVPKGAAAFKAQPPHGETNLRVFATLEPLTLDLAKAGATKEPEKPSEAQPEHQSDQEKEASRERFRKLLLGEKARARGTQGTKGIGVEEAPPSPLDGKDWEVADLWVMTGSDRKDLAERRGVSEEDAGKPRDQIAVPDEEPSGLLIPDEPATPRERPARKNPHAALQPTSGSTASDEYAARWKRVVEGQSASKSIGTRFVPPPATGGRSMPRVDTTPTDLLIVRTPPKGSKAIGGRGYTTERVPLVPPGSKAIGTPEAILKQRVEQLRASDPTISAVIPNRQWRIFGAQDSKEENIFRGLQWHLTNEAASGHDIRWFLAAVDLIDVTPAVIGMVDQGLHLNDARLKPYVAVNKGETPDNGVDDDGNGHVDDVFGWNFASDSATLSSGDDAFNHGSYCSSIIAGGPVTTPGYFFPVAYEPRIVVSACVAWDEKAGTATGSIDATVQAIQYAADRGAKVINLSLGGPSTKLELLLLSGHPVFDELEKKNVLLVIAAGNENIDIDAHPVSPACIDRPNTIVVMATDPDGRPARAYNGTTKTWEQYTNWGRNHVHIAAPGTMILGIPNVDATSYGDGTSYATPIVTATAAVIMGKHPEWDVATVKRAILESARQVEGLDDLCLTGGVLDVEAAFDWTP